MARSAFSILLVIIGLFLVGCGLWGAAQPAVALAQPSRPTLTPQARPTLTPIPPTPIMATTGPTNDNDDDNDGDDEVVPGRITGTVIDANTGAPIAGITVSVGQTMVTTDANGNYDLPSLLPGSYLVQLRLTTEQGLPLEAPITVDLGAGATMIQHLSFRSPTLLAPPAPAPTTAPTVVPAPTIGMPMHLPVTSGTAPTSWWSLVGLALAAIGVTFQFRGTRGIRINGWWMLVGLALAIIDLTFRSRGTRR